MSAHIISCSYYVNDGSWRAKPSFPCSVVKIAGSGLIQGVDIDGLQMMRVGGLGLLACDVLGPGFSHLRIGTEEEFIIRGGPGPFSILVHKTPEADTLEQARVRFLLKEVSRYVMPESSLVAWMREADTYEHPRGNMLLFKTALKSLREVVGALKEAGLDSARIMTFLREAYTRELELDTHRLHTKESDRENEES